MTIQQIQEVQFRLHPKQIEIHKDKHRFRIAECGRRWGKTQLAWIECLLFMLNHPSCLLWWVAPLYKELTPATKTVRDITPKNWIAQKSEMNQTIRYIRLYNGAECYFHSADREDSLRGSGLHGVVVDEAPTLKETRWSSEIEPSLMDYDGWALFIGTPKGINWFSRLRARGEDPFDQTYKSWRFDSYCNTIEQGGFLKKSSIDTIANDLPEMIRRQEIFAEELEGEGIVFRKIRDCIQGTLELPQTGISYVIGADLAKLQDYSVYTVARQDNGHIVAFDRTNQIDWVFQRKRLVNLCQLYNARLLIDSSGVGDPVLDELRRENIHVDGYKFTSASKKELIENLSIMMENRQISFPNIPELINELEIYGYEITPSHNTQYSAPEGYHDDIVISLALTAWQLRKPKGFFA